MLRQAPEAPRPSRHTNLYGGQRRKRLSTEPVRLWIENTGGLASRTSQLPRAELATLAVGRRHRAKNGFKTTFVRPVAGFRNLQAAWQSWCVVPESTPAERPPGTELTAIIENHNRG